MYTLTFQLKQHTPLIHFQHEQAGATLRATELKPKLDKFLLLKLREQLSQSPQLPDWVIETPQGDKSLDYKVRIEQTYGAVRDNSIDFQKINKNDKGKWEPGEKKWNEKKKENVFQVDAYPFVLANMGGKDDENELKHLVYYKNGIKGVIKILIHSLHVDLLELINTNFRDFLFRHNFGNRQSKGFGSFYILGEVPKPLNYWFTVNVDPKSSQDAKFRKLFGEMGILWKALRAGINEASFNPTKGIYFKSLIFHYARNNRVIQWDKKWIKATFFKDQLQKQRTRKPNSAELKDFKVKNDDGSFKIPESRLMKDILGLSSREEWGKEFNNAIITKENIAEKENLIERFASPVLFKPISVSENEFRVYLFVKYLPTEIEGQVFNISDGKKTEKLQFPLNSEANPVLFFRYLFQEKRPRIYSINFDDVDFDEDAEKATFKVIKRIIEEIRTNYPKTNAS